MNTNIEIHGYVYSPNGKLNHFQATYELENHVTNIQSTVVLGRIQKHSCVKFTYLQ